MTPRLALTLCSAAALLPAMLYAAPLTCPGVQQTMPAAQQQRYLTAIAAQSPGHPAPSSIRPARFMAAGAWSAVFATPPGSERGVFFFRLRQGRPVFSSTWGGVAGGDSATSIAAWTRTLDPAFPQPLADCFAQAVTHGD